MDLLNDKNLNVRLEELRRLIKNEPKTESSGNVNNHIHTFYSFSPYSPTKAVYMALKAGLDTAGIMDHDSVAGCREFIEAGKIAGIGTTIGAECRVDFSNTSLNGKRINNPDQSSVAYVAIHAIPHRNIDKVADFFKPYTIKRNERNRAMVLRLNSIMPISIDFDKDVVPLSKLDEGGSITERHILFALSKKIIDQREDVITFLSEADIKVNDKMAGLLNDKTNPYRDYDLLGVLKGYLVSKFYIDAKEECPDVARFIALAKNVNAISAYAYLGDVGNSVTGDKKAQKFEDDYIEQLFDEIDALGFDAVTYMPTRNTIDQLIRVKELCKKHNLMEISGEDINSPRQGFICEALKNPIFSNLIESTWDLIKHENNN